MNSQPIIHKDKRRILYDWCQGNFKSAKAVEVLEEISIGDHYHEKKEEVFFLIKGKFIELHVGGIILFNVEAPHKVFIAKGVYHRFVCEKGSILLGVATDLFDEDDEIKLPKKSIVNEHY